jgi:hypothetical protein
MYRKKGDEAAFHQHFTRPSSQAGVSAVSVQYVQCPPAVPSHALKLDASEVGHCDWTRCTRRFLRPLPKDRYCQVYVHGRSPMPRSNLFYPDAVERILASPSIFVFNCINTCPNSSQLNVRKNVRTRSLKAPPSCSVSHTLTAHEGYSRCT